MKNKKTLILTFSWVKIILLSFFGNRNSSIKEQTRIALLTSRSVFAHILTARLWNARHGRLYVPVTPLMQPNRYREATMRDIKINESLTLTQINPSFMTRQLSTYSLILGHVAIGVLGLLGILIAVWQQ